MLYSNYSALSFHIIIIIHLLPLFTLLLHIIIVVIRVTSPSHIYSQRKTHPDTFITEGHSCPIK